MIDHIATATAALLSRVDTELANLSQDDKRQRVWLISYRQVLADYLESLQYLRTELRRSA